MSIGTTSATAGFNAGWDWKDNYVDKLSSGAGLERFSQGSLTPDTTLLFAGPPRFSGVNPTATNLKPIGLIDQFNFNSSASVQPLYEIGSNRSFFTRGKTQNQVQISAMLADHASLMKALSEQAYDPKLAKDLEDGYLLNSTGPNGPGEGDLFFNLDSEAMNLPLGILMVFKTKGAEDAGLNGKIVGATYLEACHLMNFTLQAQAQGPTLNEQVSMVFDRAVPVKVA